MSPGASRQLALAVSVAARSRGANRCLRLRDCYPEAWRLVSLFVLYCAFWEFFIIDLHAGITWEERQGDRSCSAA